MPGQQDKLGKVEWTEVRLQGQWALAPRAAKKLIAEGLLLTQLGGVTLRYEIDRVPLWQGDDVDVKQLWEYLRPTSTCPACATRRCSRRPSPRA